MNKEHVLHRASIQEKTCIMIFPQKSNVGMVEKA